MTDKPVEAMKNEELIGGVRLEKYPADFTGDDAFGTLYEISLSEAEYAELSARLRERDAANNRIEQLLENMANLESPFERGAIYAANEVLSAMLAARAERKE